MRKLILAAAAAALLATPAMAAKKASHTTGAAPTPAASTAPSATPAKKGGSSKLADCRTQWGKMSDADKAKYNDMAKGKTGKKGGKVSGYNVFTSECAKKA